MSVTWTQLLQTAETGDDFSVTTTTYKGTGLASGYLIRVDVDVAYQLSALEGGGALQVVVGGGTAITRMTTAVPTGWSWAADTPAGTNPLNTTYVGTPLDGSAMPIGTERVYRQDKRFRNGSNPGAGNHVSLTTMTP